MKVYMETLKQFGTAPDGSVCLGEAHVYSTDTPDDWDVCTCGKYFFLGAKEDQVKGVQ
jgi:hypothetical protein